eukprot:tig00000246_g21519.t1
MAQTAGALVTFFAAVAPIASKTGALKEEDAIKGTTLLMEVIQLNPALQSSLAGMLAALPATSTLAATLRTQTQAALATVSTQITLSDANAKCGVQERASDIDPYRFKVCPGTAASLTVTVGSATFVFPASASTSDFQVSVSTPDAGDFPGPSANNRVASAVYDITATKLGSDGKAVFIKDFPDKIRFEMPATLSVGGGQSVSLAFYDEAGKKWTTCSPATSAPGCVPSSKR